jgi:hypothetical protein
LYTAARRAAYRGDKGDRRASSLGEEIKATAEIRAALETVIALAAALRE